MKLAWNARTLRLILLAALLLLIAGGVGIFSVGKNIITEQAAKSSQLATEVEKSNKERDRLMRTKNELAKYDTAIERVSKIAAESKSYQYQNQITEDVYRLAGKAGIAINGISFETGLSGAPGAAAPAAAAGTPAATPAASPDGQAATPAAASPAGVTPTSASITIGETPSYESIVNFIYMIEQNLTKMRIKNVALSATQEEGGGKGVSSDALTIEVYIRQ